MAMNPFLRHTSSGVTRQLTLCVALLACILLAACGFRLKGATPLPIETLYTNIAENSSFGAGLRRAIRATSPNTRFVMDPAQAQAQLIQIANNERLRELSIDADGRVEEYELNLEFVFQVLGPAGEVILPPTTLRTTREIPYDDTIVQARQSEISNIFEQMRQSMIDRVVRHLTAPDVIEAFNNLEQLPVTETPADLAPVSNDPKRSVIPAWGAPDPNPNAGMLR